MTQDIRSHIAELLRAALKSVAPDALDTPIVLDRPKQAAHGDFASNLALQLAKPLKRAPRDVAQLLVSELPASPWLEKAEIAGAGFINFTLKPATKLKVVGDVLAAGDVRKQAGSKRSRSSSFPPTRPARCTLATAVAPLMALRCPVCFPLPAGM
jgi:arginyl-tRNA synthetase